MPASARTATSRLRLVPRIAAPARRSLATSTASAKDEQWPQRTPLGAYYASILRDPIPYPFSHKPEEPPSTADPSVLPPHRRPATTATTTTPPARGPEPTTPPPQTAQEKARIIFGSRLLGPAEQAGRLASKQAKSTYVAGVLVPPQPEEPDNCCMSGCVNCVWERYREDMEEWTASKREAERRLLQAGSRTVGAADGGGSETSWSAPAVGSGKIAKDMWDDEVYRGVPVGIREFMKQEKRLKERHAREGTVGG
ncbi:hypothetical protein H634G_00274 [Metarhizium anisopliae BRIP 53293]|uniref:Oxidoreductase-like domain-containing protein n=1 Tax=Metarhizium anisopliae BRIP 53293 TaxID=1291518 RepID=A0A0D9PCW1_METAN|nr:hypothetical protein H634G_00274 [Metarhizium anisopliae BRIP 53293]KJK87435.1 hypothetical protein H633G_08692 [Metarhizium anisopliae BRIP 53284]